jgi:hypothetical protein
MIHPLLVSPCTSEPYPRRPFDPCSPTPCDSQEHSLNIRHYWHQTLHNRRASLPAGGCNLRDHAEAAYRITKTTFALD